ncbi:MAG: hypothetical protein V1645_01470 [archaeon]
MRLTSVIVGFVVLGLLGLIFKVWSDILTETVKVANFWLGVFLSGGALIVIGVLLFSWIRRR